MVNRWEWCFACLVAVVSSTAAQDTKSDIAHVEQAAYTSEDVRIASRDVVLRGTAYWPSTSPAIAAVVLVPGAGKQERMGPLARALASEGFAVLSYDKRGVGESGGIYAGPEVGTNNVSTANLSLLAHDASAALDVVCRDSRTKTDKCGFIGISQAGWIVPLAARENRVTCFMVLWSGAVETTHEDMRFESLALHATNFWDQHTHADIAALMKTVPDNFNWADFDPRRVLRKLRIPGFWLFGGRDRNVDVDLSIERLNGLVREGHRNYQYRLYPQYDHLLAGMDQEVIDPTIAWIADVPACPSTHLPN